MLVTTLKDSKTSKHVSILYELQKKQLPLLKFQPSYTQKHSHRVQTSGFEDGEGHAAPAVRKKYERGEPHSSKVIILVKVKVKFNLRNATKAQTGSRGIPLQFL